MSKFLGFLLGVAVALAGPAVFGVLAAPGGIELNTKEMALAFGISALIFWAVVSYFSGAGALGAFIAFGTLIYCWLWIPNRTTNFLNDVPGVTTGMIDGSKQFTLNGVVPILAVISLVYAIQLIVRSVQRRRRERVEADRLQREQEAVQAQQEADAASVYPVAGSTYPAAGQYIGGYSNRSRFDDLFDEEAEPEPVQPRNQADEQTAQFPVGGVDQTTQIPENDAPGNDPDETVLVPTDRDETVQVPATSPAEAEAEDTAAAEPEVEEAPTQEAPAEPEVKEPKPEAKEEPAATQTAPEVKAEPTAEQKAPEVKEAPAKEPEVKEAPAAEQKGPEGKEEPPAPKVEEEQNAPEGQAKREQKAASAPAAKEKEQVGSQYRERMEDPEDTGEFHFTAFETPVVRPAGT